MKGFYSLLGMVYLVTTSFYLSPDKKIYNSKYDFYINSEQALADGFATKII